MHARPLIRCLASLGVAALAACGGTSPQPASALLPDSARVAGAASPIKHVVIVVQENRSFDNLFATYPGATGATHGLCRFVNTTKTFSIPLQKSSLVTSLSASYAEGNFVADYDGGKMDGFCNSIAQQYHTVPYEYVDPQDIRPYWALAQQYVLADHMFETQGSGSFIAHQVLIRGSTVLNAKESIVNNPQGTQWGCGASPGTRTSLLLATGQQLLFQGPRPCFGWPTLRDLLDAKHVSWKYYTPSVNPPAGGNIWNAFYAIRQVYRGTEWDTNVVKPETMIFKDISSQTLPAVSWVIPDYYNSDHPGDAHDTGPSWVAQIVNAIGGSPSLWNSTAIVVVWDDWGGWYDNVPPPQLDYDGLAFRVPCLIISPYAKKGYVAKTPYEFGSILKFVEDTFALGRLNTTDARATSIANVFDFAAQPRPYTAIPAKYSRDYFVHQPPSNHAVDDR